MTLQTCSVLPLAVRYKGERTSITDARFAQTARPPHRPQLVVEIVDSGFALPRLIAHGADCAADAVTLLQSLFGLGPEIAAAIIDEAHARTAASRRAVFEPDLPP